MGKVITIAATDADPGSVVGEAADNPTAVDVHPIDLSPRPVEPATPESSADPNRLFQSRSAAYRWLVANAARFGFVNYPFEPWHWEWTGQTSR